MTGPPARRARLVTAGRARGPPVSVVTRRGKRMRRGMVLLAGLALIGALVAAGPVGARPSRPSWQPKARGELDCNGYSKVQAPWRTSSALSSGGRTVSG